MDAWILGRIGYDLYALDHDRALPQVERFSRHLGGSSANMAVGLSRLGLKVGIISVVGDDLLADYLFESLREENVDTRYVGRVAGFNTSLCLTEVWPPDHFRQVFYRANPADTQITASQAALSEIRTAKMFITNGTNLTVEPARSAAMGALTAAREAGVTTIFDVDYRASSWTSPGEAGEQARHALPLVDVVLANEEELSLLSGRKDAAKQIEHVLSCGTQLVVQKLGARGVAAHTASEHHAAASQSEKLVCAVGGGDGFASGFLYALHRGFDVSVALAYGNAAAAVVVSRVSCADVMPRLEEIESRVRSAESRAAEASPTSISSRKPAINQK